MLEVRGVCRVLSVVAIGLIPLSVAAAPPPTPAPKPVASAASTTAARSSLVLKGESNWSGKVSVGCLGNDATATSDAKARLSFRGGSLGRDAGGAFARISFHNAQPTAGEQKLGTMASVTVEFSAKDGAPWKTYSGIPGNAKVVFAADRKSAKVSGGFSSAISDDPVLTVEGEIVCQ